MKTAAHHLKVPWQESNKHFLKNEITIPEEIFNEQKERERLIPKIKASHSARIRFEELEALGECCGRTKVDPFMRLAGAAAKKN